jgi:glycosyltransferase involved in cell wall biosynthesis
MPRRTIVSCIMPTHNRRALVPQAIRYFLRQDLTESELIVLDDGTDCVSDLMPDDPRIRYIRLPERHTIGQKRNLGCAQAWGEIIVHWDDDDWMASWRLSYQAESLLRQEVDVSGLPSLLCYEVPEGRAWLYHDPAGGRPWVAGATFCYRRSLWERHPFPDINEGSDTRYLWEAPSKRVGILGDPSFYVALLHGANANASATNDPRWLPCPPAEIASLMGEDWPFSC